MLMIIMAHKAALCIATPPGSGWHVSPSQGYPSAFVQLFGLPYGSWGRGGVMVSALDFMGRSDRRWFEAWGPFLETPDNFPGPKIILGAHYSPIAIQFFLILKATF